MVSFLIGYWSKNWIIGILLFILGTLLCLRQDPNCLSNNWFKTSRLRYKISFIIGLILFAFQGLL